MNEKNRELRTVVVTGPGSAIGQALCLKLLRQGAHLILITRDRTKGNAIRAGLVAAHPEARIDVYEADLADQTAVVKVCRGISARHESIDGLFLNAGVLLPSLVFSAQGNEMHYEVNTVSSFLLIHGLRQSLACSGHAAVVASGSGARRMVRLAVDQLKRPQKFAKMMPYAASKQALTLCFQHYRDSFDEQGISLRVVDLGPTKTAMSASPALPGMFRALQFLFAHPDAAAEKLLQAASKPAVSREPMPDGLIDLLEAEPGFKVMEFSKISKEIRIS